MRDAKLGIRLFSIILALALGFTSCNSDPNVAKKRYLDLGNKYFERGKYKEANIMYRRALEKDKRYGTAYYKLALTDLKQGTLSLALSNFHRAIELLGKDNPDHWDSVTKLTDIYLWVAHDAPHLKESEDNIAALLARNPKDFDGHRMLGDLNYVRAIDARSRSEKDQAKKLVETAIGEYHIADSLKPSQVGVLMQLAKCATFQGDSAAAQGLYQQVIGRDKTQRTAYTDLYRLYLRQGNRDEGEKLLKLAFQNNPKDYSFLTTLALHYSTEGRRADMLNVLGQIKSHSKDFPRAYQVVGDFYIRLGDPDSAVREYKEGMVKDPAKKAIYQKSIMQVLIAQNKRGEAAELDQDILKENPNDSDARSLEASFLLDKGDVTRALTELQAVVTRTPDNAVARYNLGRAHLARSEWEQARQSFQKAIELRPDYLLARIALAQLLVTRGDYDAAIRASQDIVRVDRGNKSAGLIESAALLGEKKYVEARAMLNEMLARFPNAPDVIFQLAVVSLAEGKYKDAYDNFQRTYELNPGNSRGLMGMVETEMAENKPDLALKTLEAEAAKNPNRLDVQVALGNTEVRNGNYDAALGHFQRVLSALDRNSKTRGDILMRIGETYRRKGDLQSSITSLQDARKFLPDNELILSTLALVLDAAGQYSKADEVYLATIKLNPDNAVSLNNLAFLLADHGGDLDQALTLAQRAKQLLPNLPEVSDTLGWIYLHKNLNGDAVEIFKGLVTKVPTSSTYRYHLAKAYYQQGDKLHAANECNVALKYNPTQSEKNEIQQLLLKAQ